MKTKLLIIVMALILFVNSFDLRVFANTDYNHNELLEYEGYAEAMYESIVEQTTFVSGRYTENKDYVNESINQVTDYARGWWDEYMRISELPPKEKIREMINAAGGYALTVGDFIKNLFTDYEKDVPKEEVENPLGAFFEPTTTGIKVNDGFYFNVYDTKTGNLITKSTSINISATIEYSINLDYLIAFNGGRYKTERVTYNTTSEPREARTQHNEKATNVGYILGLTSSMFGLNLKVYSSKDNLEVNFPDRPNRNVQNLVKYINDGNIPSLVTPQPKAYLSCPDGTRVNMKINGGTFLDVKGNIMSVDKNGTATIDSQICNLGWEKPKIEYIDSTDQIGITTPDGEIKDVETGETIVGGDDKFDDEIKDGCGTLCALGKLLTGLGSIAKAIAAIPLKILDGLFELVKKIFIPEDNFWTTNLDSLKNKFFHDELKEVQNGVESLESVGGGQFGDVTGSLMGVDNLTIIDSSSINMSLEKIHSWVRGFFYPLLLFFNINQMYRVIRGTSLIGIGGKKEE